MAYNGLDDTSAELERMIDDRSIRGVLYALAFVAERKAIAATEAADAELAANYLRAAKAIGEAYRKVSGKGMNRCN